jgi:diguanylate cyclase (GGDEF)-like protein
MQVAKTLSGALRGADVVGRWGGDEFLAIAYGVSAEVLAELAERCVALVDQTQYRNADGGFEGLSIAAGAALVEPRDTVERLIARADRKMYDKKSGGGRS